MKPKDTKKPPIFPPRKRRFTGTSKKREHYDRKVITYGFSRSLSLGRIIPEGWRYVRVHVLHKEDDYIEIGIELLAKGELHAPTTKTDKTGEQDA